MNSLLRTRKSHSFCSSFITVSLRRFSSSLHHACKEKKEANSFIHPSAVIHPNAVIGRDVSIGPFCTIGSSAKLGNGCQLYPASHVFGNTELGDRCVLMTGAVVGDDLPGETVLGSNNVIGHHAVVGVKCQDMKYKSGEECFLDIGDNNEIREHVSIHRSSKSSDKTVIGDNNLIMGSCHIAHDCKIGNHNIFANNTLLAGHVIVEVLLCRTMCTPLEPVSSINFVTLARFLSSVVVLWFHKMCLSTRWCLENELSFVVLIWKVFVVVDLQLLR